jgi:copper ion binding protein
MKRISLNVQGMSCINCVHSLNRGLDEAEGIENVDVNLEKKLVTVSFDENKTNIEAVKETILDLGYDIIEG